MKVGLLYLSRKEDNGLINLSRFYKMYFQFNPGIVHDLIFVFKGYNKNDCEKIDKILSNTPCNKIFLDDNYFDLGSYFIASKKINNEYIFLLNTYSSFDNQNWLKIIYDQLIENKVIAIGATGSFETIAFKVPYYNGLIFFLMKCFYRLIFRLKNNFYFKRFPNPHLRTNGLLINRELFINYINTVGIPKSKYDSLKIESGTNSLTNYIIKNQHQIFIVGKNGKSYPPEMWKDSGTFCSYSQNNLIIKDNQTEKYARANDLLKKSIEFDVWMN